VGRGQVLAVIFVGPNALPNSRTRHRQRQPAHNRAGTPPRWLLLHRPPPTARRDASWRFLRIMGFGSSIQGTATKETSSSITWSEDWPPKREPASSTVPGDDDGD
jgi:hypothetical protein